MIPPLNVDRPDPDPDRPSPSFDPEAEHQFRPRLRPVRGFPAQAGDQQLLGLTDARQIARKAVFINPGFQYIIPKFDGTRDLDQILAEAENDGIKGLKREMLERLVANLDDAGLLFGPRFDDLWEEVKAQYASLDVLPPGPTAALADALAQRAAEERGVEPDDELRRQQLAQQMDAWIDEALKDAEAPSFDVLPRAVVAPHLDYQRGWLNYAHAWGRMRVVDRPDRIVILGTNHFGEAPGVCGCDKGFLSPFGRCDLDEKLVDALREGLGADADTLFAHRYDHEREHSIELQIAWIQHCLGPDEDGGFPPVFGALVHDPAVNNGESYTGDGLALAPFVEAMRAAIERLGGSTLFVASADLSHVGPAFGDQRPLTGDDQETQSFRNGVVQHDREMLELLRQNKPDEIVAAMAWQQNRTRWCSTGNLVATLQIVQPRTIELLNYSGSMDQQGMGLVTSAAAVMY